jgi:hypothetical protein
MAVGDESILTIPDNVGERFALFTPAGLLPAAIMGLDVRALLLGAAFSQFLLAINRPAARLFWIRSLRPMKATCRPRNSPVWRLGQAASKLSPSMEVRTSTRSGGRPSW